MIHLCRISLFLVALLLTAASTPVQLGPPPFRLLATLSPQGVQEVTPGAVISRALIGRPDTAVLGDAVGLPGGKRALARGDILRAASIAGADSKPVLVFCEGEPSAGTPRACLFDSDEDAAFDRIALIGSPGPTRIAKIPYALIEGRALGGDSIVRLRYAGPVKSQTSIAFDLEVSGFGQMREVPGARHFVAVGKLPAYGIINGAVVTILKYDPATATATLRMDRDLAPGHIFLSEPAVAGTAAR